MTEISVDNNDKETQVILGDESSERAMSLKLAQAFYNELTGKSERIKEEFNSSFILTKENIQYLHDLIIQSTVQYNVVSANVTFSVEYINNSSERFSSIDRFLAHAGIKGLAIEELYISYNLLVILPQTKKPQEYKININIISRCAKVESMKEDMNNFQISIPLWHFESRLTCVTSVDFVDITVANAFMSTIKSWVDCLETTEMNFVLKKIRRFAKFFPIVCQYGLLLISSYYTHGVLIKYFETPAPESTAKFILLAILVNFMLLRVGKFIGYKAEKHLNQIYQPSYINFSGADMKLAKNSSSSVRTNVTLSIGYIIGTVILGVFASIIANNIS